MNKRINIVLPERILRGIDRMVKPGGRSRFIAQAVEHFVSYQSTEALKSRLEHAAVRDRDLDREVAADWFAVDSEAWRQLDTGELRSKVVGRSAAKSTSRRSIQR